MMCFNVFLVNARHPIVEQRKGIKKKRKEESRSNGDESFSRRRRENTLGRCVYERSLRS